MEITTCTRNAWHSSLGRAYKTPAVFGPYKSTIPKHSERARRALNVLV